MLLGGLEKIVKAKRQAGTPRPPQPYDDFEDVEEQPASEQTPPQTLEEMMRRMMQTVETQGQEEQSFYPEKTPPLEVSSKTHFSYYQPIVNTITDQSENQNNIEEKKEISKSHEFVFDIRQAVIASEILNRKY